MDWVTGIQRAIDYIEAHLTEEPDMEEIARAGYSSPWHFQRVFGLLCGFTVGEYIRNRRMTLAAADLVRGDKVIDVALRYGYDSPDSFSRAFFRFHGVLPGRAKEGNVRFNSFSRLSLKISLEGADMLHYTIEKEPGRVLTGFGKRFTGAPYGQSRAEQEDELWRSTRALQWLLRGAEGKELWCVIANGDGEGYDYYIGTFLDEDDRNSLFDPGKAGLNAADAGLKNLEIPPALCAVFRTEKSRHPIGAYITLRKRIAEEWLPASGYRLADAPERAEIVWSPPDRDERFVRICLPVEKE